MDVALRYKSTRKQNDDNVKIFHRKSRKEVKVRSDNAQVTASIIG
jgi:hypothetical protein